MNERISSKSETTSQNNPKSNAWQSVADLADKIESSAAEAPATVSELTEKNESPAFTNEFLSQNEQIKLDKISAVEDIMLREDPVNPFRVPRIEDMMDIIGVAIGLKPGTLIAAPHTGDAPNLLPKQLQEMGLIAISSQAAGHESDFFVSTHPKTAQELQNAFEQLWTAQKKGSDNVAAHSQIGKLLGYPETAVQQFEDNRSNPQFDAYLNFFTTPPQFRHHYVHSREHAVEEYRQYEAKLYDAAEQICPRTWEAWQNEVLSQDEPGIVDSAEEDWIKNQPPVPNEIPIQDESTVILPTQGEPTVVLSADMQARHTNIRAIDEMLQSRTQQMQQLEQESEELKAQLDDFEQNHGFFRKHFGKTAKEYRRLKQLYADKNEQQQQLKDIMQRLRSNQAESIQEFNEL